MPRSLIRARRCAVALALLALLVPSTARAHTALKRSEPASRARLGVPPTRISLWFTARPQLAFSRVTLVGSAGEIPLGALAAESPNGLRADILGPLAPGEYTVRWRTASADGHAISGEYSFTVLAAANDSGAAPNAGASTGAQAGASAAAAVIVGEHNSHVPPDEEVHAGHPEYRTARWIEFVALLAVLGALGFRHGVLPPLAARGVPTSDAAERARRLGSSTLVLYALAIIARAYNESVVVHGEAAALDPDAIGPMLTQTLWGIGWLFGAVGAALVALGWWLSRRRTTLGTPLALTGALGMTFAPALSGHAAASSHFVASVVLDVIHVSAAGLWLGGLVMVLFAGVPALRRVENGNTDAAVSALVNSFHPLALFCAPLVIVAGMGTAYLRLESVGDLWHTGYGLMLLRKTACVVLLAGTAAYNGIRMRRRLGAPEATRRFRWTGMLELLFATGVLAFTTWLVSLPVPAESLTP